MIFGAGPQTCLGSLDLLFSSQHRALFGDGSTAVKAKDAADSGDAKVPDGEFDLVIMNPPFTRSTNHENKSARPRGRRGCTEPGLRRAGQ